jgi:hypothetical protein
MTTTAGAGHGVERDDTDGSSHGVPLMRLLQYLGNHEGKLIVAAVMADAPHRSFTSIELYREVIDRQGPHPSWRQDKHTAFSHCVRSLAPLGAVTSVPGAGERPPGVVVAAYQAVPGMSAPVLALAGALLEWSLDYPDVSVQALFGKAAGIDGRRAVVVRYRLFRELLSDFAAADTLCDLLDRLKVNGYRPQAFRKHVDRLNSLGVLTVDAARPGQIYAGPKTADIHPGYRQPIIDLVDRVESLNDRARAREHRAQARRIIADPDTVRVLMHKAKLFSPETNVRQPGPDQDVSHLLMAVVERLGRVNVHQALYEIAEETGRILHWTSINKALVALVRQGRLVARAQQFNPAYRTHLLHYSLPDHQLTEGNADPND